MQAHPDAPLLAQEISRKLSAARETRSALLYDLAARSLRSAWRAVHAARGGTAAALTPMLVLGLAAAALALPIDQPRAQEKLEMSAIERSSQRSADAVALAELGLDPAAIDTCEDVELLWRAVRELVLPGRVAPVIQQRILRRVWAVDPDIRSGSVVPSTVN